MRALNAWKQLGIGLVIVQAINPPAPYPPTQTRQQLGACRDAGIPTDLYVYLFPGDSPSAIVSRAALADGFQIRRVWLDCEEPGISAQQIGSALAVLDAYPSQTREAGVYTAQWFWPAYVGTDAFRARPLWTAQYDGVPDPNRVKLYGGWQAAAIKQYVGTSTLAGVGNVDLDILSDAEAAAVSALKGG